MKNDTYVDQSARDLNLCIYAGTPDLEGRVHLFKESTREVLPGIRVRLGIIGASHFFSYYSQKNGLGFTELLACTEPPPFRGEKHVIPFHILSDGGFGSALGVAFPRIGYSFTGSVRIATLRELDKVARFKEKLLDVEHCNDSVSREIALMHDFSAPEGSTTMAAREEPFHAETLLLLELLEFSCVQLTTIHTYPNEQIIVSTMSEFSLHLGAKAEKD